jgi:hypothetical protein
LPFGISILTVLCVILVEGPSRHDLVQQQLHWFAITISSAARRAA